MPKSTLKFVSLSTISIVASLMVLPAYAQPKAHYLGTASCASSNCHGNAAPIKGSEVLQNEFVTWYRHDSHSKAYAVLLNEQSKRIAHNLSITSAETDPLCLSCHATYVPEKEQQGDKFRTSDGVSCESCHGASSSWLKAHVASDASHEKNVSLGMTELRDPQIKVRLCLSCHLGNEDKTVNHRLIGAGHPRLSFETDTYEAVMPRHWKINSTDPSPTQNWLIGQVIQAAERTKALYSSHRSYAGLFPEFSNMHCYSCHHALSEQQYQSREYGGRPGEPNLNTSELWVLARILRVLDPQKAELLSAKLNTLRADFAKKDIKTNAQAIVKILDNEILPFFETRQCSTSEQEKIFNELIKASHLNLQYETAEQIAMGAAAIAAANPKNDSLRPAVKQLYQTLDNPEKFDPLLFGTTPARTFE